MAEGGEDIELHDLDPEDEEFLDSQSPSKLRRELLEQFPEDRQQIQAIKDKDLSSYIHDELNKDDDDDEIIKYIEQQHKTHVEKTSTTWDPNDVSTSTRRGSVEDVPEPPGQKRINKQSMNEADRILETKFYKPNFKGTNANVWYDEELNVIKGKLLRKNATEYIVIGPDGEIAPDYYKKNFPRE